MFFDGNYKGTGKQKPAYKSDLKQGIMCIVCALFCFINFRQMYIFAMLFIACAVFRFFHYVKLKKREEALENMLDELEDEEDEEDSIQKPKLPQKERKAQYHEFLNNLEKELGDFDEDGEYQQEQDGE